MYLQKRGAGRLQPDRFFRIPRPRLKSGAIYNVETVALLIGEHPSTCLKMSRFASEPLGLSYGKTTLLTRPNKTRKVAFEIAKNFLYEELEAHQWVIYEIFSTYAQCSSMELSSEMVLAQYADHSPAFLGGTPNC